MQTRSWDLAVIALAALLAAGLARGATLSVTSERVLQKIVYPDRIESFGIHRDGVTAPHLKQVIIPVGILIQNPDTTVRGSTTELLRHPFSGGFESLGRVGSVDRLAVTPDNDLLIQTRKTLARFDLQSDETVWKIPLPTQTSTVNQLAQARDGALYLSDPGTGTLRKLDPRSGATLTVVPSRSLLAAVGDGEILTFTDGRFRLIDDSGQVKWEAGKVYPHKSYGGARVEPDGAIVLDEYVSATHPDENLRRKTWLTVLGPDGTERWNRVTDQWLRATGHTSLYVQGNASGETYLAALDKQTGAVVWSKPVAHTQAELVMVSEIGGKLFVGIGAELRLLDAATGSMLAAHRWEGRTQTRVLGGHAGSIVVTNRDDREPYRYYLVSVAVR